VARSHQFLHSLTKQKNKNKKNPHTLKPEPHVKLMETMKLGGLPPPSYVIRNGIQFLISDGKKRINEENDGQGAHEAQVPRPIRNWRERHNFRFVALAARAEGGGMGGGRESGARGPRGSGSRGGGRCGRGCDRGCGSRRDSRGGRCSQRSGSRTMV
jgi:hypothetical protein